MAAMCSTWSSCLPRKTECAKQRQDACFHYVRSPQTAAPKSMRHDFTITQLSKHAVQMNSLLIICLLNWLIYLVSNLAELSSCGTQPGFKQITWTYTFNIIVTSETGKYNKAYVNFINEQNQSTEGVNSKNS